MVIDSFKKISVNKIIYSIYIKKIQNIQKFQYIYKTLTNKCSSFFFCALPDTQFRFPDKFYFVQFFPRGDMKLNQILVNHE